MDVEVKQKKTLILIIDIIDPTLQHLYEKARKVKPEEKIEITNFSESIGVNQLGFFITDSVTENKDQIIIMASK